MAVYDDDNGFAVKFADYVCEMPENQHELYAFTEYEALFNFSEKNSIYILLVSEKNMHKVIENIKADNTMILWESDLSPGNIDCSVVNKYQAADIIYKEAVRNALKKDAIVNLDVKQSKDTKIYGVYSPVGRCGKTTFALTLCRVLGKKARVLYMNLEDFSGWRNNLIHEMKGDLSDLIYYSLQSDHYIAEKICSIRQKINNFDYIPPMVFSEDLRNANTEDINEMIRQVCRTDLYDCIVLDISLMVKNVFFLLNICDEIFMPMSGSKYSECKIKEYEEAVKLRHLDAILKRTKKFVIPKMLINEEIYDVEKMTCGKIEDYVAGMIGGV